MSSEKITITLPEKLISEIRSFAQKTERKVSGVFKMAVEEKLTWEKRKLEAIRNER